MRENMNNEDSTLSGRTASVGFKLLTRQQVAAMLSVSVLWIWRALRNPALGFPKPVRLGDPTSGRAPVRFVAAEVEAWVRDRRLAGATK
jgi:predicted DNA-binding transcriptional regulator AlpA